MSKNTKEEKEKKKLEVVERKRVLDTFAHKMQKFSHNELCDMLIQQEEVIETFKNDNTTLFMKIKQYRAYLTLKGLNYKDVEV